MTERYLASFPTGKECHFPTLWQAGRWMLRHSTVFSDSIVSTWDAETNTLSVQYPEALVKRHAGAKVRDLRRQTERPWRFLQWGEEVQGPSLAELATQMVREDGIRRFRRISEYVARYCLTPAQVVVFVTKAHNEAFGIHRHNGVNVGATVWVWKMLRERFKERLDKPYCAAPSHLGLGRKSARYYLKQRLPFMARHYYVENLWMAKDGSCLREHSRKRALCGRDLDVAQADWYFGKTHPTCAVRRERNPIKDLVGA